jgi:Cd2+/Zn2+-exporting ATPase
MDGRVIKGDSAVDEKAITGESMPADKGWGDKVYAGSINGFGGLEIEVQNLVQENTLARIITLVEDAQGQKAPSQQFVDRFARYYTPAVIFTALLVACLPPLLLQQPFTHWVYQALGMLLVACPCALVISTPVAIASAIGSAAREGVLIKGGAYLEEMGDISVIAFDKTGTLTRGEAEVTDFITLSGDEKVVLSLASAIESRSEHPLARAIVNYAQKQSVSVPEIDNFQAVAGQGAYADLAGKRYYIGNLRLFENQPCSLREKEKQTIEKLQNEGKTVMLLGDEQNLLAMLAVADTLRENSVHQISLLKRMGMDKIIMLTGDNERTARAIASKVGVDEFQASLLPADKLKVIKDLLAQNYKVAMVGDGVNDAPALAMATVGIAMGAVGTDTALETADIALMADDLSKVAYTIQLGRRTLAIIKQNIAFSLLIKAAILLLVIPGWLTLWLAVLGDMGTSLLVTLNGMRLLRSQRL